MLDTAVTPELAAEGLARDVIRVVQQARREAGLDVADRITLVVEAPRGGGRGRAHQEFVAAETLATSVSSARPATAPSPARPATARRSGSRSPRLTAPSAADS